MIRFLLLLAAVMLAACQNSTAPEPVDEKTAAAPPAAADNTVILETGEGRVVIQLRPDLAPKHAERIRTLVARKFYDGVVFHRVLEGFMAQTGDPTGTGRGGSDLPDLPAEFSREPFTRGTVGMARSSDPDSANSQFFIVLDRADWLDGQYTLIGKVTEGMEVVDKIRKGDPAANGMVENPDKIIKMRMESDAG